MAEEANLEKEFKFDVGLDFELPDLVSVMRGAAGGVEAGVERLGDQRFVTTYFDTTDLQLWERGITLRHRAEAGGGGKWTLKLPAVSAGGSGLARTELSWKGGIEIVPAEAFERSGVGVGGSLRAVVSLAAERRRMVLGGWGEIDDDVVTVTSGPREGLRFRQVELELVGPAPAPVVLDAVLAALAEAGAVPDGGAKFAMAVGLD